MSSWEMGLIETAKEELEILQTQYPNRFAYLKSDLESFISRLRKDHAPPPHVSSDSDVVLTQESSNCKNKQKHKKRKYIKKNIGDQSSSSSSSSSTGKIRKNNDNKMAQKVVTKRKTRVEMVLENAQRCLQKIRAVKASLR
ncbi:hypothetical protein AALP_AA3G361300 [Arabis alpina]|uniref:Uncharacterized protein n=1 Tax=Arabis alpina TaxID=50452 RepID=A0A087HDY7_ARAAL|nr:hypothetical protein AALP_AA3G361300 [Arabis alpina]